MFSTNPPRVPDYVWPYYIDSLRCELKDIGIAGWPFVGDTEMKLLLCSTMHEHFRSDPGLG